METRVEVLGKRISNSLLKMAFPICFIAAGCSGTVQLGPLDENASFVAIEHSVDIPADAFKTQAVPPPGSSNQSFYLALNKKELGQRWFMSAYMKQFFPGAVLGGAAMSLGTKVVTFRVQNGKLFVFDASDLHKTSDTFDPTLILEAYPIINTYGPFNELSGSDKFVLFDPAAGINRFGVVSDMFAWDPTTAANFQVDAAYMQNFRNLPDGATYEQVFTGSSATFPINDGFETGNVFRASGTLGLALRKYGEGENFVRMPYDGNSFYFYGDIARVPNEGAFTADYVHWNVHKGMTPIKWKISDQFKQVQADFPQYDVIGAIERGITNWNEVFGFKALEAEVATANDSYADDDTNYLIYDSDPSFGAAFANWRQNPNTGEIRGASVYFNAIWLMIADLEFSDDGSPMSRPGSLTPKAKPKMPSLTWGAWKNDPLCVMWAQNFRPQDDVPLAGGANAMMTKKQKVEAFLTHVVVHEIGHTLGLRHNFAGSESTTVGGTSVMEYILDDDAVAGGRDKPGPYDIDAIKYLYGMATDYPTQLFCTDEDTLADPDCNVFDRGADPLKDWFGPNYRSVIDSFLDGTSSVAPNTTLNGVLKYVRAAATSTRRVSAFQTALKSLQIPVDATKLSTVTGYGARVDFATRNLFTRLYLAPAEQRGDFTNDPPADSTLTSAIMTELRGNILNSDKIRSYATRRAIVDILKKMQTQNALNLLVDAKGALETQIPTLSGNDKVDAQDLLARINVALNPYFN
jgi:hypothetical protein